MSPTYGKQFSEIYNEVAKDVGDETSTFITEIKKKINDVGRSLFQKMDYAWKKRTADITLVADTQSYLISDIASDWDELTPVDIYYRDSANGRMLLVCYDDAEWIDKQDDDTGDVHGFHIEKISGSWKVSFVLIPNGNFVSNYSPLKMEYFKKWTELSSDTDIPDIPTSHHQLLVYRSNQITSIIMENTEAAGNWKYLADKEEGLLNRKQIHRLGRPSRVYPRGCLSVQGQAHAIRDYNL